MGLTYIDGEVSSGKKKAKLRFLVDSGATYTLLPEIAWKSLKLKASRTLAFVLADGTRIERGVSECKIHLPQGEAHTPVILGAAGDEPLLGAVTLEILGLVLNPFSRELQPMRMMLA
ncbi:MAG: aspartyl protease family protein [Candidatus Sumerlaeaceae bacterium]